LAAEELQVAQDRVGQHLKRFLAVTLTGGEHSYHIHKCRLQGH
jgi:hypothetical protein